MLRSIADFINELFGHTPGRKIFTIIMLLVCGTMTYWLIIYWDTAIKAVIAVVSIIVAAICSKLGGKWVE